LPSGKAELEKGIRKVGNISSKSAMLWFLMTVLNDVFSTGCPKSLEYSKYLEKYEFYFSQIFYIVIVSPDF